MIPEAVEPDEVAGVISIVLGFTLMMALMWPCRKKDC